MTVVVRVWLSSPACARYSASQGVEPELPVGGELCQLSLRSSHQRRERQHGEQCDDKHAHQQTGANPRDPVDQCLTAPQWLPSALCPLLFALCSLL